MVTDSVVDVERSQCVWAGVAEEVPPASRDDWVWTGPLLGSPSPGLPSRARRIGAGSLVASLFTTRASRTTWFQPGPSFLCSGEGLAGADLCAGMREETPSFWLRSPCARFAAGRPCLLPLTATTIVGSVVDPQLQHLSCCFEVATALRGARLRKPRTWVRSRSYAA
jgi:hypothetical protein